MNVVQQRDPLKDPFDWLLRACVSILAAVLALYWAVSLLAQIWPWLVAIGLVASAIWWWMWYRTRW